MTKPAKLAWTNGRMIKRKNGKGKARCRRWTSKARRNGAISVQGWKWVGKARLFGKGSDTHHETG